MQLTRKHLLVKLLQKISRNMFRHQLQKQQSLQTARFVMVLAQMIIKLQMRQSQKFRMLLIKYLHSVLHQVHYRTDQSIQLQTLTMYQRTHLPQSLVSVIQIWQKRWLTTARIIFLLRLDSPCLHRLISLLREYYHFFSNM